MLHIDLEDIRIALKDSGQIFEIVSFIMLVPIAVTLYYSYNQDAISIIRKILAFVVPAVIFYVLYLALKKLRLEGTTRTKHAMITVALVWLIIPLIGSLPFLIRGILNPVDSFFESVSGWTATGFTMIRNVDSTSQDILFYRSLTEWVGGIGIIVLALVVFMRKGTVATVYYSSERGEQRIKPSIKNTVIETWKIYFVYTLASVVLLFIAGMGMFDAINHSFAALATGGFSKHTDSIAYFQSPLIEFILMIFMLIGSISFLLHFRVFSGGYKVIFRNVEFKSLLVLLFTAVFVITLNLYLQDGSKSLIDTLRDGSFQVVSSITTTGFSTVDIGKWPEFSQAVLMSLMYIGGFYGSTAGGIKLLRLVVIIKLIQYKLKKLILPKTAIVRMKIGSKALEGEEIMQSFGISSAYLIIAVLGGLVISSLGYNMLPSLTLSLSAMGSVGLSPVSGDAWFSMPVIGKFTIIALMWIGRLEIFPVLIFLGSFRIRKR